MTGGLRPAVDQSNAPKGRRKSGPYGARDLLTFFTGGQLAAIVTWPATHIFFSLLMGTTTSRQDKMMPLCTFRRYFIGSWRRDSWMRSLLWYFVRVWTYDLPSPSILRDYTREREDECASENFANCTQSPSWKGRNEKDFPAIRCLPFTFSAHKVSLTELTSKLTLTCLCHT